MWWLIGGYVLLAVIDLLWGDNSFFGGDE